MPGKRGPSWMLERGRIYRRRALARSRLLKSRAFDVSCQHHLNSFTDWFYLRRAPERTALVSFVHDVIPHEPRVPRSIDHALQKHTYRAAGELVVYHRSLKSQLIEDFGVEEDRNPRHQAPTAASTPWPASSRGLWRNAALVLWSVQGEQGPGDAYLCGTSVTGRQEDNASHRRPWQRKPGALVRSAADELPNVTCESDVPKDSMERLFRESHVAVLPYSSMASQSGVLAAAYSNALPVIVTDVGALGETVREDGTGVVVPPNDPASLAASISSIASTPSTIHRFSEAIHAVAPDYSHERVGMSLRAVFDHAVTRLSREGLVPASLWRCHRLGGLGRDSTMMFLFAINGLGAGGADGRSRAPGDHVRANRAHRGRPPSTVGGGSGPDDRSRHRRPFRRCEEPSRTSPRHQKAHRASSAGVGADDDLRVRRGRAAGGSRDPGPGPHESREHAVRTCPAGGPGRARLEAPRGESDRWVDRPSVHHALPCDHGDGEEGGDPPPPDSPRRSHRDRARP